MKRTFATGMVGLAVAGLALVGAANAQAPTGSTAAGPPMMPPIVMTDPAPEGVRVDAPGVFANYFQAGGGAAGKRPAVLLLGGSEGGLGPGATRMGKGLAAHGFNVLQIAYFGAPGQPKALVSVPLETFAKGLAWLRSRPEVEGSRVAIVGGSKGAEAALLYASRDPSLKAVVVGMPSSVVWPGISYTFDMKPSWTESGRDLPFVPYAFGGDFRSIYGAYDGGLKTLAQHQDAIIPAERATGPILLICGKADTLWPSCPMAEQVVARLKNKAPGRPVQMLEYADAGHAVFGVPADPASPAYATLGSLGGSPEGNNAARKDGWPRVLAFLDQALAR